MIDADELKAKRICADCVGEDFLKELVAAGTIADCDYCDGNGPTFTLEEMSERVEGAFDQHYTRTFDDRYERNDGDDVVFAIGSAAVIDEDPARDIQQILADKHAQYGSDYTGEPTPFDDESTYAEKATEGWYWQREWREFERSLKTESRYFSQTATEHLTSVFAGIEDMQTASGQPVIVTAGPETERTHFYRARAFESVTKLEEAMPRPDLHVGPPPPEFALGGRMNARGISVFYGADSPETALAEVRPPVGSRVLVAKFDLLRSVRLLDLQALADIRTTGSIFDPTFLRKVERAKFLGYLLRRITMPVMPSEEGLQYLATQAVADFLASRETPELDGILFPSVQVEGASRNVVLFQKSSRTAELVFPKGTVLSASVGEEHEEGWETNYSVVEEVPPLPEPTPAAADGHTPLPGYFEMAMNQDTDSRVVALAVDLGKVEVREVKAVSFATSDYDVTRMRWSTNRFKIPF